MEQSVRMQHRVQVASSQEPGIHCANIGVVLNLDQQVTLTGTVTCDAERITALETARRVPGVSVVRDALVVHAPESQPRHAVDASRYPAPSQAPRALDTVLNETNKRHSSISTF